MRAAPCTERRPAVWFADELEAASTLPGYQLCLQEASHWLGLGLGLEAASRLPGYQLCLQEASHLLSGHSRTRKRDEERIAHARTRLLTRANPNPNPNPNPTLARTAGGRRALHPFGLVPRRARPGLGLGLVLGLGLALTLTLSLTLTLTWYHAVLNLEFSAAISQNFIAARALPEIWPRLR